MEAQIELLKTRIVELKQENESISKRLSKEDARRKKAISDKQAADSALNKAEKKIEVLDHELKNIKDQGLDAYELSFKKSITLTNARSCDLLFQIGSIQSKNENLLSILLAPNKSILDLNEFEGVIDLDKNVKYLLQRVRSPTGMALFYDMNRVGGISVIVTPPFPISETGWKLGHTFDITKMQEILNLDWTICIVLAHAGETFMGISNQEAFIDYKIVRSSVKEKHTKGGWSQRRFERLRDEDIRHHVKKARGAFETLMDEYKNEVEVVVISGEHRLFSEITGDLKERNCPILIKNIDAKVEKHRIDRIQMGAWSFRWYELP